MPSLTQPLSKKRRHDDFDANAEYHILYEQLYGKPPAASLADKLNLSPQDLHHDIYAQRHGPPPKKIISLSSPRAKKLRMMAEQQDSDEQTPYSVHTLQQTNPKPTPLAPSSRHNHARSPSASKLGPRTTITTNVLAPCHICHRKPTKKTELDSYADCQGCGERTCYVCMRECLGWATTPRDRRGPSDEEEEVLMRDEETNSEHEQGGANDTGNDHSFNMEDAPPEDAHLDHDSPRADHRIREGTWVKEGGTGHRGRICSRCCVEEGVEGEVTCLGCLAA
ncbi:hypothetical protein INS49_010243 [Diaporthe citri]|uniref:uncharacterized protein n=1 Tax=Diaporthe citri TaxID=83186 RepID=UPI001C824831|nr:uncharacterized protein INS49_010243 [Diaporthe citri]KAG6362014.1 hypothetical protein INS49_010243 [Diaporthe citri]